jgi:molecular chaperone GrpE
MNQEATEPNAPTPVPADTAAAPQPQQPPQPQPVPDQPGTSAEPSASDKIEITAAQLKKYEEAAALVDALKDQLLRTKADWDNYRKRTIREKEEAVKYASESVLEKLLPILDSFEMGLQAAQKASDPTAIAHGMQLIYSQFQSLFKDLGVETIDAVGQPFDPHRHEAIGHQESHDHPEGTVSGQLRRGYKLKDRLLRPASVFVAKKPHHPKPSHPSDSKPNA